MLTKSYPAEFKVNADKREIEGYASVFGVLDQGGDVVMPGAFSKTIAERMPKGLIKVLWQHMEPLGMPTHMAEDSKGLHVRGRISKTRLGDEALTLIGDGVVDRLSIGYAPIADKTEWSDDGSVRVLREVKLYEFSPVTFAMNEEAVITGLKSLDDVEALFRRLPDAVRTMRPDAAHLKHFAAVLTKAAADLSALPATPEPGAEPTPAADEPPAPHLEPALVKELHSLLLDNAAFLARKAITA